MENVSIQFMELASHYAPRVAAAVIILIVGRWIASAGRAFVRKLLDRSKVDRTAASFLANLAAYVLWTFVLLAALNQLGVQTASIIAVLAAAALAVGLALRDSLSNLAAGLLMVVTRPFELGHWIETGGVTGIVEEIHIFTTRIKTFDNAIVVIPNAKILGDKVTNNSITATKRVNLVVGVSYESDLRQVRQVIFDVIRKDDRILDEPEPSVTVKELAESSVNQLIRIWVKTEDQWPVSCDLLERIKTRFDDEGISMPFPQRDVHVHGIEAFGERRTESF
jgi:small conductance mechanosensitive channel